MTEWNPGPPPAVGWYLASVSRQGQFYRWWDGRLWSLAATPWFDREEAVKYAAGEGNDTLADSIRELKK